MCKFKYALSFFEFDILFSYFVFFLAVCLLEPIELKTAEPNPVVYPDSTFRFFTTPKPDNIQLAPNLPYKGWLISVILYND